MRAVIYVRISEDRTGLAAGVGRQEQDSRALCARRGWDVVDVVVDNDISASRYARKARPGWTRVMAMAVDGDVDVIAGYHTDRMYRRPSELEALIDLAEKVLVSTVEGDFRLDTSDGRAMARVIAAMSAKASDDSSRRLRRKHLELAEQGQLSGGGRRPFGFEDDRVTLRPDEVVLIREAAARVLAGDSLRSICRSWEAQGIRSVSGKQWQATTLRRLLEAPRIAGLRSHRGRVVGEAVWPAVLPREEWEAVRSVLASPPPSAAGVTARSYLLSGLVRCGRCDVPMTARPVIRKGNRYRRYACTADRGGCDRCGVGAEPLEDEVTTALLAWLTTAGPLAEPEVMDPGDGAARMLAIAEADLDALAQDLAMGSIGRGAFAAASVALESRIVDLRRSLTRSRSRGVLDELVQAAEPGVVWDAMSWDRQRAAVVAAISAVHIAPTSKAVNYFDRLRVSIDWR